jgi:Fe-S cluster biogenesis protein NfuA
MFRVDAPFVERGTYEYTSPEAASEAPLPRRLFSLDGVEQVLVTSRFVTVNKQSVYAWPELVPAIKGLIREHLRSGEPAVPARDEVVSGDLNSELARGIAALIDQEIRPAVAMDGGDVHFLGVTEENVVKVRLIGSCSTCPSATATLALGVERLIKEEFPEITAVEQEM